jgi:hypothetical protein
MPEMNRFSDYDYNYDNDNDRDDDGIRCITYF